MRRRQMMVPEYVGDDVGTAAVTKERQGRRFNSMPPTIPAKMVRC